MIEKARAVHQDGAFLPENTEVGLPAQPSMTRGPTVCDVEERTRILQGLTERMKKNCLPSETPRLRRDELHERR